MTNKNGETLTEFRLRLAYASRASYQKLLADVERNIQELQAQFTAEENRMMMPDGTVVELRPIDELTAWVEATAEEIRQAGELIE